VIDVIRATELPCQNYRAKKRDKGSGDHYSLSVVGHNNETCGAACIQTYLYTLPS